MKITAENLKIHLMYKVTSGLTDKIQIGDVMSVQFERGRKDYWGKDRGDEFTIFRWKRKGEDKNEVWHVNNIKDVIYILTPFEFEIDKEYAEKRINELKKEINAFIYNYGLEQQYLTIEGIEDWSYLSLSKKEEHKIERHEK
jgi:hypothetical protein